jgi:hypothetical protein
MDEDRDKVGTKARMIVRIRMRMRVLIMMEVEWVPSSYLAVINT